MKTIFVWALLLFATGLLATAFFNSKALAETGAPQIMHGKAGFESCLDCHQTAGAASLPASHTTFSRETCLSCHTYSSTSTTTNNSQADSCLSCHSQQGLSMDLPSGERLQLYIDAKVVEGSIHGNKLLCSDCHTSITGYPHPKRTIASLREYSVGQYESCKQCHFANYTKSLDSVHYKVLSEGSLNSPLCTDCHGAHNVSHPDQPRAKISTTCSECHQDLNSQYVESVHGKALIGDNNFDVPVCTDCHPSHTIEDPRTAEFRIRSVDLCSSCHSNEKLMKKYNISTNVVQSYLQDFHGSTVALVGEQDRDIWVKTAVCTDCHGVHDIKMVNDPDSPVIKANLEATCAKCHTDANINFPGAWLSHYEPTINKASLVFLVKWFYRIMIPFIIVGLSIHVLLDLWRAVTNR